MSMGSYSTAMGVSPGGWLHRTRPKRGPALLLKASSVGDGQKAATDQAIKKKTSATCMRTVRAPQYGPQGHLGRYGGECPHP